MKLTLSTSFEPDYDLETTVTALLPDGKPALVVHINFLPVHKITYETTEFAKLTHLAIAEVILASSKIIDSAFTWEDVSYTVEIED